jgi:glucose-1-phosphate thymidylyltransferase
MKAVILCAGYGTRLYPLTKDCPKPLLAVGGKPVVNYIIEKVERIASVNEIEIVTNAKFKKQFAEWQKQLSSSKPIRVFHDPSMNNEDRLGAVLDLQLVIEKAKIKEDVLVIAGDNIFTFELSEFVKYAERNAPAATIGAVDVKDKELAKQYGILEINEDKRLLRFLEKPVSPPTTLASMGLYYFPKEKLEDLEEFLKSPQKTDAPGFFVEWLLEREAVHTFVLDGVWYDIGDLASYESADKALTKKK